MKKINLTSIMLSALLLIFSSGALKAQNPADSLDLSIEEAIDRLAENNYSVLLAREQRAISKAKMNQANAVFLPQVSLEETALQTTDPVAAFGIKLRQGIATAADFNPAVLNDPDAIDNYNTRVQVLQPLFNPDGFMDRAAARAGMRSAQENEDAVRNRQVFMLKELYYRLQLFHSRERALITALELAGTAADQAENYFEQGLINRAEYLEARVQLLDTEEKLLNTRNSIAETEDELRIMLGLEQDTPLKLISVLRTEQRSDIIVDADTVNNAGLRALSWQLKASEKALQSSKFSFIPKINLFGSYEFNDNSLFGLENDNYTIGATLRWDLFKGFSQIGKVSEKKAEYRSAQLRYDEQYDRMRKEVRMRERSVGEAVKKIELNQLAAEQAEEEYRIRSNRYEQGLEKTSDLLKSETRFLNKELALLQAYYDYRVSLASLEYLLETDF